MEKVLKSNAQTKLPKFRNKFVRRLTWILNYPCYMINKLLSFFSTHLLISNPDQQFKKNPKSRLSVRKFLAWVPYYICSLCAKIFQYFLKWLFSISPSMPDSIKRRIGYELNLPNCVYCVVRKCIFWIVSVGPVPLHIAFIMDGNRRYANKRGIKTGSAYHAGFLSLMTVIDVCYELGVKYATIYAFSIDNFRRKSDEVSFLLRLLGDCLTSLANEKRMMDKCGIRINFVGNLSLLPESLRSDISAAMESTQKNNRMVLSICVAYTSTDEIIHATQDSCKEKLAKVAGEEDKEKCVVSISDLDRNMYMGSLPDPDLLIRSSGRSRLSNFMLWQTPFTCLDAPQDLWPDMSAQIMFWAILKYQRVRSYLQLKKLSVS